MFLFYYRKAVIISSNGCLMFPQLHKLSYPALLQPFAEGLCQTDLTAPKDKASHNPPEKGFMLTSPVGAKKTTSHTNTALPKLQQCNKLWDAQVLAASTVTTWSLKAFGAGLKMSFCIAHSLVPQIWAVDNVKWHLQRA